MTLKQFITSLEKIALTQKDVRTAGNGDIYTFMNSNPNLEYAVVFITQEQHRTTEYSDIYGVDIFYADRQVNFEGASNLQIQSIGKEVIMNIIRIFCDTYDADLDGDIYWQSWREKFADNCCGIYATVNISVPLDTVCAED